MKRDRKVYLVCVASWLALQISARAVTVDSLTNPYQLIVTKNVFHMNALPDLETSKPKPPPPPNITLQGITSYFGRQQVLFSAAMLAASLVSRPIKLS